MGLFCYSLYCKKNNIVSGFFRIHPLVNQYFNKNLLDKKTVNKLVTINLEQDPETIFSKFKHSTRKSIRKAKEANVIVKKFKKIPLEEFKNIYYSMK